MILRNPFLLVIQVLLHVRAICAPAFPCTETQPARYAAWSTYPPVYGIDTNSSSLRTTTPSLAAHRVPPSATSSTPTDIRRSARPVPTSGHDRGAESMILRNPFLLVIQVLLHVRAICAPAFPCTETQPARYAAWSTYPPVYGIDTNSSSLRTTTPFLAAHRVPPSATSSTPTDIRRSARPVPTSGHDKGAETMILRNLFLLVIQVLPHVRAICAPAFSCTETQPARYAAWSTAASPSDVPFCLEGHVVFGGGTSLDFPIAPRAR
ncbi:hypothetical protein MRX96_021240 [Rhipicephalus microplus]